MKEWQDIEKIVFLSLKAESLNIVELMAVNDLTALKVQFNDKKISKDEASSKKVCIKLKYQKLIDIYNLIPDLINMIAECEWTAENTSDFAEKLIQRYGVLHKKAEKVPLIQFLSVAIVEYYDLVLKKEGQI